MKSSIKSTFTLCREDDIGKIETTLSFVQGMPDTLDICQKTSDGAKSKVSFTKSEIKVLRYAMIEFGNFIDVTKNAFEEDEEESPSLRFGRLADRIMPGVR